MDTLAQKVDFNAIQGNALPNFKFTNLASIVVAAIPYIFAFSGIILLFLLIQAGFNLMLSKGDPKLTEKSMAQIVNSIIGFLIIFAAYWIVQLVGQVLGLGQIITIFK